MKPLINDYTSFNHTTKTKNMNILRDTWQDKGRISRQAWFSFFPRKKYKIRAYYNYSCLKYMNNSLKWDDISFLGEPKRGIIIARILKRQKSLDMFSSRTFASFSSKLNPATDNTYTK